MADPHAPDAAEDPGAGPDGRSPIGMPLWVKMSGVIAVVLILLVAVVMITGAGGEHGPGRHSGDGDSGGQTPPAGDHKPPAGGHSP